MLPPEEISKEKERLIRARFKLGDLVPFMVGYYNWTKRVRGINNFGEFVKDFFHEIKSSSLEDVVSLGTARMPQNQELQKDLDMFVLRNCGMFVYQTLTTLYLLHERDKIYEMARDILKYSQQIIS